MLKPDSELPYNLMQVHANIYKSLIAVFILAKDEDYG